jgi:hypothetical protein
MSSGSLRQFLKKTKKNNKTLKVGPCCFDINFCAYFIGFVPPKKHKQPPIECVLSSTPGMEAMVYSDLISIDVIVIDLLSSFLLPGFIYMSRYLHSCEPPIIHGNLTTDTIFIQHNGLIKIGSGTITNSISFSIMKTSCSLVIVAPDAIHSHVKTCKEEARFMQYAAPEYGGILSDFYLLYQPISFFYAVFNGLLFLPP